MVDKLDVNNAIDVLFDNEFSLSIGEMSEKRAMMFTATEEKLKNW